MANVYLASAIREMETSSGTYANYEFATSTCQGWRNTQEDVHLILPGFERDSSLFAVFDGHNGIEVAAYAAKYLPDFIRVNKKYRSGQIVEGLREAFILLDNSILLKDSIEELKEIRRTMHPNLPEYLPGFTSGCTGCVLLIKGNTYYCANVGDSRCVLVRNGKPLALSIDTKPEIPTEMERIEAAGGKVFKGRINGQINVSRAFGDHMYKSNASVRVYEQMIIAMPDVTVEPVNPQDQYVTLMCDGIWNSMTSDDVAQFVSKRLGRQPLRQITEELINHVCPEVMPPTGVKGKDNMTFMVIKFNKANTNNTISAAQQHPNRRK